MSSWIRKGGDLSEGNYTFVVMPGGSVRAFHASLREIATVCCARESVGPSSLTSVARIVRPGVALGELRKSSAGSILLSCPAVGSATMLWQ